jgi:NADH-quinone oxidoreductase subunit F
MFEKVLTRNVDLPRSETIGTYLANGGYQALRKALQEHTPEHVIQTVIASGLRGRGGAGFPAGRKWSFMPKDPDVEKYVCVNTDEGEPGTFKDRELVEKDPHQIIEGVIIASYAVGARRAFVYIRGEFFLGVKRWIKAIDDAYAKGFLGKNILGSSFSLDLSVHRGAGAYICGEETALIESLEGRRGEPRRDAGQHPAHYQSRRGMVCVHWHAQEHRAEALLRQRARARPRCAGAASGSDPARDRRGALRRHGV